MAGWSEDGSTQHFRNEDAAGILWGYGWVGCTLEVVSSCQEWVGNGLASTQGGFLLIQSEQLQDCGGKGCKDERVAAFEALKLVTDTGSAPSISASSKAEGQLPDFWEKVEKLERNVKGS